MSYIGNTNTSQGFIPAVDYFSGNGSTLAFTLSKSVATVYQIEVVIDNVIQNPSSSYTVLNNVITFSSAPLTGTNNIWVRYVSLNTSVVQPGVGTVGTNQLGDVNAINSFTSLAFKTNVGVERMRIDASGNVGIGTSSPTQRLTVIGSGQTIYFGSATRGIMSQDSGGRTQFYAVNPAVTAFHPLTIDALDTVFATSSIERMRIDSSGNVGIGTSSPAQKLHIASDGYNFRTSNGANSFGYNLGRNVGDGLLYFYGDQSGNNGYVFSGINGERMRIDSSGNVGIGTSSPNYPLSVTPSSNGTAINAGNAGFINAFNGDLYPYGSASLSAAGAWTARGTGAAGIGLQQAGAMVFYTNAGLTNGSTFSPSERMRIDSSGNVGIGTSSPSSFGKFAVVGSNTGGAIVNYFSNSWTTATANTQVVLSLDPGGNGYNIRDSQIRATNNGANQTTLEFYTANAAAPEYRARINASGQFLIGTSSNYFGENLTVYNNNASTAPVAFFYNPNPSTTGSALIIQTEGASGTTWRLIEGRSAGGGGRFYVYGNGNVQNTNNSYGAISDESVKESIVDATHKLDDLCKVKIRNFNLKNDENKIKQIGVVAQELEQIFPAMVEEVDGLKGVKYSIFVPILVKAIQELKAIIDTQQTTIVELQSDIKELKGVK